MTAPSTPRGPIVFAVEDRAVLHRLRTAALLFRAAADRVPILRSTHLGLLVRDGCPSVINLGSREARLLITQTAGLPDPSVDPTSGADPAETFAPITRRISTAEFPAGLPGGLRRLLERTRLGKPVSPAATGFLTQARWRLSPIGRYIVPDLPQQVSAHEALDALCAAEEVGGLGDGPIGLLARKMALRLAEPPQIPSSPSP